MLVAHIDEWWMKKKGMHYPWSGRDFKDLKSFCRSFQEWGVMALWDVFAASPSDFVKKSGYSIGAFVKCLPWLVDDKGWKGAAAAYAEKMRLPLSTDLFTVVDNLAKKLKGGSRGPVRHS